MPDRGHRGAALAFVALGSNVGDRQALLHAARGAMSLLDRTTLVAQSAIEETAPFGPVPQGPFLNQMVALRTALGPTPLLAALHAIERRFGRVRARRWGPRTLDLDLVSMPGVSSPVAGPILPHPGLGERDFWSRELAELERILARAS
jgi:2-amino-4-hydroxy-6-hydroxymethyldihydropteridine diphosphokinase